MLTIPHYTTIVISIKIPLLSFDLHVLLDGLLIRTTVKVGFRVLPSRKQLDEILFHGQKSEMIDQYKNFIQTIKQIYDTVEGYYAEKKYLQLP